MIKQNISNCVCYAPCIKLTHVCACVHVCASVCVHHTSVCVCVRASVCICVSVVCVCACVHVCLCMRMCQLNTNAQGCRVAVPCPGQVHSRALAHSQGASLQRLGSLSGKENGCQKHGPPTLYMGLFGVCNHTYPPCTCDFSVKQGSHGL